MQKAGGTTPNRQVENKMQCIVCTEDTAYDGVDKLYLGDHHIFGI